MVIYTPNMIDLSPPLGKLSIDVIYIGGFDDVYASVPVDTLVGMDELGIILNTTASQSLEHNE